MKKIFTLFYVVCFFLLSTTKVQAQDTQSRLNSIYQRIDVLEGKLYNFWKFYGLDKSKGGFSATLNSTGASVEPYDKSTVQQTRHLWTFSSWYTLREQTPEVEALCINLYNFITTKMYNSNRKWFYLETWSDGSFKADNWRLYENGFAVYALSQYAITFNKPEASQLALQVFNSMDQAAYDTQYGGYDNRKGDASGSCWLPSDAEKETNTTLHLMEAFTTLYQATGNAVVKQRLNELVDIVINKIIQPSHFAFKNFNSDWSLVGTPIVSYGHDIETMWLVWETAKVLDRTNEIALVNAITEMGKLSADQGFDASLGGYFYEGVPGGSVTNYDKQWWVQAECLPGLVRLFKFTADTTYLTKLERTLTWIETYQLNKTTGEWYDTRDRYGNATGTSNMGHYWKASYHTLRATMYAKDFLQSELITSTELKGSSQLVQMNLYPSPTEYFLNVQINEKQVSKVNLTILNNLGQVVYADDVDFLQGVPHLIDVSAISSGVYYLMVKNNTGDLLVTNKFIKK